MKKIKNFIFIILGVLMIIYSGKLMIEGSDIYTIIGGICLGVIFIYPSIKKETKTDSEKFVENNNIDLPIWWKRLLGFIIDFIIISVIIEVILSTLIPPFVYLLIIIFYYMISEVLFKTTLGKSVFKLKVVSCKSNKKLTLLQVMVRSFSRLIPIDFLFFFTKRPIGLHDIISKTIVVKREKKTI